MRWKQKALAQGIISRLPPAASYELYYRAQRTFGALRRPNPLSRLTAGLRTWERIVAAGHDPSGRVFFEIGTGRVPLVPIAFWLMGARSTVTVDLNPYMKEALIRDHLDYIAHHSDEIRRLFGDRLDSARHEELLHLTRRPHLPTATLLDACAIDYRAPADAASTSLAPGSIDFHTSYTTFEHIPPQLLMDILQEGDRILAADGLSIHRVDYSDHFSHSDKSITAINFLQFSQDDWDRYAGNRYMYMNRLRHDDYLHLFETAGQELISVEPDVDNALRQLVERGEIPLDPAFSGKDSEILATTGAWWVTRAT